MKTLRGFLTAGCLLMAQPLMAEFPAWYPTNGFSHYGKVDEIDAKHKTAIIDDSQFQYTDDTAVHSLSEKSDSLEQLNKNAMIGFRYDRDGKGRKIIREVWLLPEDYTQENSDDD